MSNQFIAYGAKMEKSTDGTTYISIPEVDNIVIPSPEKGFVEVTNLDSPDGYREYIPGLKDAGTISFNMGYTQAAYRDMIADSSSDKPVFYKMTLALQEGQSKGDEFIFKAFPTPKVENGDLDGAMKIAVDLRVTGAPTWVEGS